MIQSWLPHEIITRHTHPRTRGRRTAPVPLAFRAGARESLGSRLLKVGCVFGAAIVFGAASGPFIYHIRINTNRVT